MVIAGAIWTKHRLVGRIWSEEAACRGPGVDRWPRWPRRSVSVPGALSRRSAWHRLCVAMSQKASGRRWRGAGKNTKVISAIQLNRRAAERAVARGSACHH